MNERNENTLDPVHVDRPSASSRAREQVAERLGLKFLYGVPRDYDQLTSASFALCGIVACPGGRIKDGDERAPFTVATSHFDPQKTAVAVGLFDDVAVVAVFQRVLRNGAVRCRTVQLWRDESTCHEKTFFDPIASLVFMPRLTPVSDPTQIEPGGLLVARELWANLGAVFPY